MSTTLGMKPWWFTGVLFRRIARETAMRCRGFWLPVLAVTVWASSAGSDARADEYWVETVDWLPTSTVRVLPSSYIVPTSYIAPTVYSTAYVVDRPLTPTSYVVPSYYETRFRRSLFGRRLIPTGRTYYTPTTLVTSSQYFPTTVYYPTSYFVPTTYRTVLPTVLDRSVVATEYVRESSACCPDATPVAMAPTRAIAPERSSSSAEVRSRRPEVQSEPQYEDDDPALSSDVPEPTPAPPAPAARPRTPQTNPSIRQPAEAPKAAETKAAETPKAVETPGPAQEPGGSPPDVPPAERRDTPPRPDDAAKAADPTTPSLAPDKPKAPAGDDDYLNGLAPAPTIPDDAEIRSESRKPVFDPSRAFRTSTRNVLFGRVRERETREPEENVRVVLSSRTRAFDDKEAWTDAFGRFAVRVPDGDWTVKVTMPSGRVYAVSEITVSNGEVSDERGRDIPSLTITR
jgi:hypothetical protein